jgi:4-hydroxybenzoate polyprenyltransferase
MAAEERAAALVDRRPGYPARALLEAARPLQWTKNLFVFAGIIFSVSVNEPRAWALSLLTFASFCAASSAAYLFNDLVDVEEDREHPTKRWRPLASGRLDVRTARSAAAVLAVLAVGAAVPAGWEVMAIVAGFLALQVTYSLSLKHVVILDVIAISLLFVLRSAAGAVAIDVRLSPWLAVCTGLLALFLALGKRRAELIQSAGAVTTRRVLAGYSVELLDDLLVVVAAATISAYSIYTFTATESEAMMLTIPFVVYGLFRYFYLLHATGLGEEPETVSVTDRPLALTVVGWVLTALAILLIGD